MVLVRPEDGKSFVAVKVGMAEPSSFNDCPDASTLKNKTDTQKNKNEIRANSNKKKKEIKNCRSIPSNIETTE